MLIVNVVFLSVELEPLANAQRDGTIFPTPNVIVSRTMSDLYEWKRDGSGCLADWLCPLIRPNHTTWTQIDSGDHHIAAVSSNGEVFTWGRCDSGELGHDDNEGRSVPTKVEIPGGEFVVRVSCGGKHTAAVTRTGKLFTWYVIC